MLAQLRCSSGLGLLLCVLPAIRTLLCSIVK